MSLPTLQECSCIVPKYLHDTPGISLLSDYFQDAIVTGYTGASMDPGCTVEPSKFLSSVIRLTRKELYLELGARRDDLPYREAFELASSSGVEPVPLRLNTGGYGKAFECELPLSFIQCLTEIQFRYVAFRRSGMTTLEILATHGIAQSVADTIKTKYALYEAWYEDRPLIGDFAHLRFRERPRRVLELLLDGFHNWLICRHTGFTETYISNAIYDLRLKTPAVKSAIDASRLYVS